MLYTIGYEKAELRNFILTLLHADIQILVDIRDRAQSRRKGFSKTALSENLSQHGIQYIHLRALGDPKEGREAARSGRMEDFKRIYGNVLLSSEAVDALSKVADLVSEKKICLLCYERDHKCCHRSIVADRLRDRFQLNAVHLGVNSFERARPLLHSSESSTSP